MSTEKLSPKQRKAVSAILEHTTFGKAAEVVGVNPKTINRWMRQAPFRAELLRSQSEAIDAALRPLLLLAKPAIDALEDILQRPSQRGASVRRLTASTILDQLIKLRDRDIDERLSLLEAVVYDKR